MTETEFSKRPFLGFRIEGIAVPPTVNSSSAKSSSTWFPSQNPGDGRLHAVRNPVPTRRRAVKPALDGILQFGVSCFGVIGFRGLGIARPHHNLSWRWHCAASGSQWTDLCSESADVGFGGVSGSLCIQVARSHLDKCGNLYFLTQSELRQSLCIVSEWVLRFCTELVHKATCVLPSSSLVKNIVRLKWVLSVQSWTCLYWEKWNLWGRRQLGLCDAYDSRPVSGVEPRNMQRQNQTHSRNIRTRMRMILSRSDSRRTLILLTIPTVQAYYDVWKFTGGCRVTASDATKTQSSRRMCAPGADDYSAHDEIRCKPSPTRNKTWDFQYDAFNRSVLLPRPISLPETPKTNPRRPDSSNPLFFRAAAPLQDKRTQ